jgi:hypothetical protein
VGSAAAVAMVTRMTTIEDDDGGDQGRSRTNLIGEAGERPGPEQRGRERDQTRPLGSGRHGASSG